MAYTDLQKIRKLLADDYEVAYDSQVGDGVTIDFKLSHKNVVEYVLYVDDVEQVEDTDYTMDAESGYVTFTTAPASTKVIDVNYKFSAFSDTELTEFLDSEGSVNSTLLLCIDILLADSSRRMDYQAGKTNIKASQVFKNLQELRKIYENKTTSESTGSGVKISKRTNPFYGEQAPQESDISRYDLGD